MRRTLRTLTITTAAATTLTIAGTPALADVIVDNAVMNNHI